MRLPDTSSPQLQEPAAALVRSTGRAKRATARMYRAWHDRAPSAEAQRMLARIAADEAAHARALDRVVGILSMSPLISPRDGRLQPGPPATEPWGSALMAAFALDQAATACLVALTHASHAALAPVARSIVEAEAEHQRFIIATFRALADEHPELGPRLAAEMIVARDWVHEVFPRRRTLDALVMAGFLTPEAPKAHDSFLASLGDRVQDALGVLGS